MRVIKLVGIGRGLVGQTDQLDKLLRYTRPVPGAGNRFMCVKLSKTVWGTQSEETERKEGGNFFLKLR